MTSIDVFIPCYNAEKYIIETLESVRRQTYKDYQAYIVDDGSSDRSCEVIREWIKRDGRFHLIESVQNHGVQYVRNMSFEICKADYIAFMDADDLMPEYRLERQLQYLEKHTDCDILAGGMTLITEQGETIEQVLFGELNSEATHAALAFRNVIPMAASIVRRLFVKEKGLVFDQEFPCVSDYNFWADCAIAHAKMHVMNESMVFYRMVPTGISRTSSSMDKMNLRNQWMDKIHKKMLAYLQIFLNPSLEQIFLQYTNDSVKTTRGKLRDFSKFMRMISKVSHETKNSCVKNECRILRKRYYYI